MSCHGLSIDVLLRELNQLRFFERASAHVLAGWSPKIEDLDAKKAAGRHHYECMNSAFQIDRQMSNLSSDGTPPVPRGWQALMVAIDSAGSTAEMVAGLYLLVRQRVLGLARDLHPRLDPVLDANLLLLLKATIEATAAQVEWAREALGRLDRGGAARASVRRLEEAWADRGTQDELAHAATIWRPLDRVPRALRPAGIEGGAPGELCHVPLDPFRDPDDTALALHENLDAEYATMELIARCSYEHPDMPWAFHLAMARQASDEARHAAAMEVLLEGYGYAAGDFPMYTTMYDVLYDLEPCPTGSRKELLWRLLLRCTFQEALSLDHLPYESKVRAHLSQDHIARVWSYVLPDEIFHVQNGVTWSRYLCEGSVERSMAERQVAFDYYMGMMRQRREAYIIENPERAIAEVEHMNQARSNDDLPFRRTLNRAGRQRAGFAPAEIQQVLDWGYAIEP